MILAQILLLPFFMVFGYVLLMSSMMSDMTAEDVKYDAYMVNAPSSLTEPLEKLGCEKAQAGETEEIKEAIGKKQHDLLVVFPEGFAPAEQGSSELSDIEIWYNTEKNSSMMAYQNVNDLLGSMQPKIFTVKDRFVPLT